MSSEATRLPTELTDTIIDFLHDDEDNLANCSLVCKAWVPATRYHIFENLLLDPWNIESFVDLINHPSNTVAPFIHQLVIDLNKSQYHPVFNVTLIQLPRFGMLQRLELRRSKWYAIDRNARQAIKFAFGGITELALSHNTLWTKTQFFELVSGFPSLQKLSAHDFVWDFGNGSLWNLDQSGKHADVPPELHVVDLGNKLNGDILEWLSTQKPTPIIDTLSLGYMWGSLPYINEFLKALGAQLQHLVLVSTVDLHVRYDTGLEPGRGTASFFLLWQYIAVSQILHGTTVVILSHNTQLRTLSLRDIHVFGNDDFTLSGFIDMLPTLKSPHLEEIILHFSPSGQWDEETMPRDLRWKSLDEILTSQTLSSLRIVRVLRTRSPHRDDWCKKQLPLCYARGLLRYECEGDGVWRSVLGHADFAQALVALFTDWYNSISLVSKLVSWHEGLVTGPFRIDRLQAIAM
jgi:hypothetical protein